MKYGETLTSAWSWWRVNGDLLYCFLHSSVHRKRFIIKHIRKNRPRSSVPPWPDALRVLPGALSVQSQILHPAQEVDGDLPRHLQGWSLPVALLWPLDQIPACSSSGSSAGREGPGSRPPGGVTSPEVTAPSPLGWLLLGGTHSQGSLPHRQGN